MCVWINLKIDYITDLTLQNIRCLFLYDTDFQLRIFTSFCLDMNIQTCHSSTHLSELNENHSVKV